MAAAGNQNSVESSKQHRLRSPLNVVVEKVGATRAMVHGDVSVESLKELLMSSMSLLPTAKVPSDDEGLKKSGSSGRKSESERQEDGSYGPNKERLASISGSEMSGKEIQGKESAGMKNRKTDGTTGQAEVLAGFAAARRTDHGRTGPKNISGGMGRPFGTESGRKSKSGGADDSGEKSGNEEEEDEEEDERSLPSCLSAFGTEDSPFSTNSRWLRRHFEKPLVQGLKDVAKKKPQDPVSYLAFWLRKYRSEEEARRRRKKFDDELRAKRLSMSSQLGTEQKESVEHEESEYHGEAEEGGGNADWNFKNYYRHPEGSGVAAEVAVEL